MKRFLIPMLAMLIIGTQKVTANALNLMVVTEDFAPFHYIEDGVLKGPTYQLIKNVLGDIGFSHSEIRVFPWARAYHLSKKRPNTLIFSMMRLPSRENEFIWSCKIAEIQVAVFKRTARKDIKINTITDINKYRSLVFIDSAIHHYFEDNGITNLLVTGENKLKLHLLVKERVELLPISIPGYYSALREVGMDESQFEAAFYLKDLGRPLWAAFNKNSDRRLVNDFKNSCTPRVGGEPLS